MKLDIQEIVKATGGRLLGDVINPVYITAISTDTRKIMTGSLFIPLAGVRVDGHDFIGQAAEKGAICALTEQESVANDMAVPLIYVKSTRRALMDLADYYRRKHDIKVVAITGSAGKTTTKDMVADILSYKYKTKRTIGNFNNDIGMPLSIFQLEADDEALVLEMGMNHANEIHELSLVGVPDIAVITHIGDAHIENFANREGILHAKLEIVDGLRADGLVVLNGDDPLLAGEIAAEKLRNFNVLFPSSPNIAEAEPIGFQETRCVFRWLDKEVRLTVPIPGSHMVMNALLATVVGLELGVSPEHITDAFKNFTPPEGRLNIFDLGDKTIIDDVYNANPASMLEAIRVLCRKTPENAHRRRVAILGDMNELGHVAEARHREVGEYARKSGVDLVVAIGELSKHMSGHMHFVVLDEALEVLSEIIQPDDIILVKGSRGMKLERIVQWMSQ
ncbi:MAG: UDP-N-acetylmuramoyl-tripeptide--D-alanyl-D-alanine ligase [Defluviitaleaceae bacterium]|nr:UDP-N-acetylmuramoyl-tripeptide--D-alanyl-D-alanine ligase [Defluviitaleaceae bacterium]